MACVSFESDPDAFIHNCVNVINGDYCESATDLVITGPDALILQRFYSTKDLITGTQTGGWRILPERFLVIGEREGLAYALTGERSGAILTYNGLKNEPLKIAHAPGMVNTYAKEINGRTSHQNNRLHCQSSTCELTLGDGTKRIYTQVPALPSLLLGEECTPIMAALVQNPAYYHLAKEILPSGNTLFFAYDDAGHLISIEMKNKTHAKTLSWIHLTYDFQNTKCQVSIATSDAKTLNYYFQLESGIYQLTKVEGSHCIPVAYSYDTALIKKILPEGRFIEIEYEQGKVKTLKRPHALTGKPTPFFSFDYGEGCTDVFDALGIKTRYTYDSRFQLTSIDAYDEKKKLYRKEQKYWSDTGLLLAKSIGDANSISLFRSFQ
jgi:YD repeat-containing protein